jgi:chromosome segregation ATPase
LKSPHLAPIIALKEVHSMSEDTTQQLPGGDLGEVLSILRSIDGRLTAVETRLVALEDKVERRLQETRPIWEQVLDRLTAVEERLTKVEEGLTGVEQRLTKVEERLTGVETRLGRVEDEVDSLGRKFRVFNKDILKLQNKDDDLAERMDRIETEHTR